MSNIPPLIPAVVLCLAIAACADNVSAPLAKAPVAAVAGSSAKSGLTLHPDGFGQKSLAAWRAQEGLSDTRGNANQALYFQKFTATTTFAAGIARITGLEGQPVSAITGLQWERRDIGWCGAGAPRWNIYVTGPNDFRATIFLGCLAAVHTPDLLNPGWTFDTFPGLSAEVAAALPSGADPANYAISGLSIVFDEGNDFGPLSGFVFLDNIKVNDQTWTSPADNGGN
jgi:hypothetical protein